MSKIYELLGYPIGDNSKKVIESRQKAYCPFMSDRCDGGGNRYMSDINLVGNKELQSLFPGLTRVPSGICSIQTSDNSSPWIICPRRLLYMGHKADESVLKGYTQKILLEKCGFQNNTKIGIWSEVKVKYINEDDKDDVAAFDYTFDYVLMPIGKVEQSEAVSFTGIEWNVLKKILTNSGHTFALRDGKTFIEDFPIGMPVIVEVMTSSTSGGNKSKRSCIPQAFEDCILGKNHTAPGINYRQVWARMASQLIVKSQAAIAWNGKTIWVIQDLLADYISSSTALDLSKFVAKHTNEVNILAFSYDQNFKNTQASETVSLYNSALYAGPIRPVNNSDPQPCFQDIIMASVCPPRNVLISSLCKKQMSNRLIV